MKDVLYGMDKTKGVGLTLSLAIARGIDILPTPSYTQISDNLSAREYDTKKVNGIFLSDGYGSSIKVLKEDVSNLINFLQRITQ